MDYSINELKKYTRPQLSGIYNKLIEEGRKKGLSEDRYLMISNFATEDEGMKRVMMLHNVVENIVQIQSTEVKQVAKKFDASKEAVIHIISTKNPKRAGGKPAERFSKYRNGMSIQEYVDIVGEKFATADINWDLDHGYIELEERA